MRQKWGKKVSRSKEARNEMEEKQEVRKVRRIFTPEQKFERCLVLGSDSASILAGVRVRPPVLLIGVNDRSHTLDGRQQAPQDHKAHPLELARILLHVQRR